MNYTQMKKDFLKTKMPGNKNSDIDINNWLENAKIQNKSLKKLIVSIEQNSEDESTEDEKQITPENKPKA